MRNTVCVCVCVNCAKTPAAAGRDMTTNDLCDLVTLVVIILVIFKTIICAAKRKMAIDGLCKENGNNNVYN